jgi:hypothetical protein
MTSFPCCGYCYILCLVDPIARYGHALPMKSNSIEVIELTLNKILSIARHHPNLIYVDNAYVQLLTRAPKYSNITMVEMPHSPLMVVETNKLSAQLDLWLEENNITTGYLVCQQFRLLQIFCPSLCNSHHAVCTHYQNRTLCKFRGCSNYSCFNKNAFYCIQ